MARFGWLCVIALAACGGDQGVTLKITSPVALTRVELFVGDDVVTDPGSCSDGSGCSIGPPTTISTTPYGTRYRGDGYTSRTATAQYAKAAGTKLSFRIEPERNDETLTAMMIVGYDQDVPVAAKVVHDVPVTHSTEELDVTLEPVAPIDAGSGERVQVWRRPGDDAAKLSACAIILHGDQRQSEWFVPGDDTDCDGALPADPAAPECKQPDAPWNYCGVYAPTIRGADSIVVTTSQACRLQGPQCADAGAKCPSASGTEQLTVPIGCIQQEVCHEAIANMACDTLDDRCVGLVISQNNTPHIVCSAIVNSATGLTACTTRIDASANTGGAPPIMSGRNLTGMQILALTSPVQLGSSASVSGVTLTPTPTGTPGIYDLVATGTPIDGSGALLLDFITDPPPTQHRFIELYIEQTSVQCAPGAPIVCQMSTSPYICP